MFEKVQTSDFLEIKYGENWKGMFNTAVQHQFVAPINVNSKSAL